jgi:hypothetical protein
LGAKLPLDAGRDDPPPVGKALGGSKALRKGRHALLGLQRIAGRNHEPKLVQPKVDHRLARDMQMSLMRRIEGTAKQADA